MSTDTFSSWRDNLLAGDVVSFVFPSSEGDAELEKARPSLVLAVDRVGEEPIALIAYGTSSRTRSNTGLELHVRKSDDIKTAGLHKQTRFVGARTVTAPLSSPRFAECAKGTAVLGRLPAPLHQRVAQVVAVLDRLEEQARRGRGRRSPWGRRRSPTDIMRDRAPCGFASASSPAMDPNESHYLGGRGGRGRSVLAGLHEH